MADTLFSCSPGVNWTLCNCNKATKIFSIEFGGTRFGFTGKVHGKHPWHGQNFDYSGVMDGAWRQVCFTDIENSIVFQRGDQDDFGRKKSLCVDPTFFSSSKLYYYKGYIHILRFSLGYLNGELN